MMPVRKHSRKRDAILSCVRGTTCHPTAEWVYTQLKPEIPDLSLGTVYRNLAMFKQDGEIVSVGTVAGWSASTATPRPMRTLSAPRAAACTMCRRMRFPRNSSAPPSRRPAARSRRISSAITEFVQIAKTANNK